MKYSLGLKKPGLAVVCLALLTVLGAFSASAQTSNGTIVGTVLDKSGSAVPKAKVTGSSSDLGVVREFTTDSTGSYRLENLPPGSYAVTVEADGFSKFQVTNVSVKGSLEVTVNAHLEIGSLTNVVTVEAGAGQELHTENSRTGRGDFEYRNHQPSDQYLESGGAGTDSGWRTGRQWVLVQQWCGLFCEWNEAPGQQFSGGRAGQ